MTWRYAPPVLFTCDGCGGEVQGWFDRLPTAWVRETMLIDGAVTPITREFCPACQPSAPAKEPTP